MKLLRVQQGDRATTYSTKREEKGECSWQAQQHESNTKQEQYRRATKNTKNKYKNNSKMYEHEQM